MNDNKQYMTADPSDTRNHRRSQSRLRTPARQSQEAIPLQAPPVRNSRELKVVLVGAPLVGKSAIIQRFVNETYTEKYIPTQFQTFFKNDSVYGIPFIYSIWDTSGNSAYDPIRHLSYEGVNAFILCFNVNAPKSLDLAITKFLPEVRKYGPNIPVIFCGCGTDLRQNTINRGQPVVLPESAQRKAEMHYAIDYVETSSLYGHGVEELFAVAAKAAMTQAVLNMIANPSGARAEYAEL